MMLEEVYKQSLRADEHYGGLALHVGPATPAVLAVHQGLEELGFEIASPGDTRSPVDFALSSLHPQTPWHLYEQMDVLKVLIEDGDGKLTWREKYGRYTDAEPLGEYEPDVVFAIQKAVDYVAFYLPYGMRWEHLALGEDRPWSERRYDFAAIKGAAPKQQQLYEWMCCTNELPGRVFNNEADGPEVWKILNDTRVYIYPGLRSGLQWDSELLWMAMAAGCILLAEVPPIDVEQYPLYDVVYTYSDFPPRLGYDPDKDYEPARAYLSEQARRYFKPAPIARYFLQRIWDYGSLHAE
jgi:hypothetical protein